VRWRFQTGGAIFADPARLNHTLFVGSWDTHLYAVDARTGVQRWRYRTGERVDYAPVVASDQELVFVGSPDGTVHAVDVATGRARWRVDAVSSPAAAPVVAGDALLVVSGQFEVPPAIAGDTIYVGGGHDRLFIQSLDAATGQERWRFPLAKKGLYALDAATGTERWHLATNRGLTATPVVAGDWVYAVDEALHKVDAGTGGERWDVPVEYSTNTRVTVKDGMIVLAADTSMRELAGPESISGWLFAYDNLSGVELWRFETGGLAWSAPVVAGDAIFIGGYDGNLHALDAATGELRWQLEIGGHPVTPMVDCDTLYVGNYDGSLIAIANA
jgi:outer membrane protein assembly factor BamB